jgi:hypothetical protein
MGRHSFDGLRFLVQVLLLLGTLSLAGCFATTPPTVKAPPEPPSGEIRLEEAIPYEQLAEHLSFNTKSRMRLAALVGRVIQVHGPVWQVEQDGATGVLRLGSERSSLVRANFADASDLRHVRLGQVVMSSARSNSAARR